VSGIGYVGNLTDADVLEHLVNLFGPNLARRLKSSGAIKRMQMWERAAECVPRMRREIFSRNGKNSTSEADGRCEGGIRADLRSREGAAAPM